MSMFEFYSGRCYDLLNNKKKLQILEDKNNKIEHLETTTSADSENKHFDKKVISRIAERGKEWERNREGEIEKERER